MKRRGEGERLWFFSERERERERGESEREKDVDVHQERVQGLGFRADINLNPKQ